MLQGRHECDGCVVSEAALTACMALGGTGTSVSEAIDVLAQQGIIVQSVAIAEDCMRRADIIAQWRDRMDLEELHGYLNSSLPVAPDVSAVEPLLFRMVHQAWAFCSTCGRRFLVTGWCKGFAAVGGILGGDPATACPPSLSKQCGGVMNEAGEGLYAIPKIEDWPVYVRGKFVPYRSGRINDSMLYLTKEEADSLRLVLVFADVVQERGKIGRAPIANLKKVSVIRAEYIRDDPVVRGFPTLRAKAAFEYLIANNKTYHWYYRELLGHHFQQGLSGAAATYFIHTSALLLHRPGIEVAAYPVLYPHHDYGDTDIKERLSHPDRGMCDWMAGRLPSIQKSFLAKICSDIRSYQEEPLLAFLLYDIHLARSTMQAITIAEGRDLSPDAVADNQQISSSYWANEQDVMSGMVRVMARIQDDLRFVTDAADDCIPQRQRLAVADVLAYPPPLDRAKGSPNWLTGNQGEKMRQYRQQEPAVDGNLPNIFITVSPAEWHFPLPWGVLGRYGACLHRGLGMLALHMFNIVTKFMVLYIFADGVFFSTVLAHVVRTEYQGRGTPHWHLAAWVIPMSQYPLVSLEGRTGRDHNSRLVSTCERILGASIDVQVGRGAGLSYVDGYVTKEHNRLACWYCYICHLIDFVFSVNLFVNWRVIFVSFSVCVFCFGTLLWKNGFDVWLCVCWS